MRESGGEGEGEGEDSYFGTSEAWLSSLWLLGQRTLNFAMCPRDGLVGRG